MKVFILEDDPLRIAKFEQALIGHEVTIRKSCAEAQKDFTPPYDLILLDHDLEPGHYAALDDEGEIPECDGTGLTFARWLMNHHIPHEDQWVIIHSYNPVGAERMYQALLPSDAALAKCPFGGRLLDWIEQFVSGTPEVQA